MTSDRLSHIHCCIQVLYDKIIILGRYSDGQVKIYSVSHGTLLGEIGAHSRSINALHIAQATGMVSLLLCKLSFCGDRTEIDRTDIVYIIV